MLQMKTYRVRVLVVPTVLETQLTGAKAYYETREIQGYTLKDAKRKAGIR